MSSSELVVPSAQSPVRVLVVDDSAMIRRLLSNILDRSPHISVIDCAVDAADARKKIKQYNPDVVTLDIEMPGMDGLSFLEKIMTLRPTPVIMCSTLTEKGAEASIRALSLGAIDFVTKPTVNVAETLNDYADELVKKILVASKVKFKDAALKPVSEKSMTIEKKRAHPKVVAIGSSTGGTVALEKILTRLPVDAPPIIIAQHIPPGFSAAFAARVNQVTQIEVREAADGDMLQPGLALIAPGGKHLRIRPSSGRYICELDDNDSSLSTHKPSVDVLFASMSKVSAREMISVMLTGMGSDGAMEMKAMHDRGVFTIAQDEKSAVVWGMPKRAIELGGVSDVVGLDNIAQAILEQAY